MLPAITLIDAFHIPRLESILSLTALFEPPGGIQSQINSAARSEPQALLLMYHKAGDFGLENE
jgi:hypothetical protein